MNGKHPIVESAIKSHTPEQQTETLTLVEQLTADQLKALNEIVTSVLNGESHVLKGFAGTGKSFLCKVITLIFRTAVFTAPTNKAVQVLNQSMGVQARTIHKLLGLQVKHGKLHQKEAPSFVGYELVALDETSMVNMELATYVQNQIMPYCPVLFIGDPGQLPPVEEEESVTFSLENVSVLTQIVRQSAGNPIIAYSKQLRERGFYMREIPFNENTILKLPSLDDDTLYQAVLNYHKAGGVYAAWTNAKVNKINLGVHRLVHGKDARDFVIGQTFVLNSPWLSRDNQVIGNIGDEFTIENINVLPNFQGYPTLQIFTQEEGISTPLFCLSSEGRPDFDAELNRHKNKKDWNEYYALKERFTEIAHTYAFTCHKLQGSTYDYVIIDAGDITKNRKTEEMDKCMYVAITRARHAVAFV